MDTTSLMSLKTEKIIFNAVCVGLTICILGLHSSLIFAKDLQLGNYTGISPTLTKLIEDQSLLEAEFEKEILSKYSGARIMEIEKGVKHIKLTRYYNNKPVKINIIELSTDVNPNLKIEPAIASKSLISKSKISSIANRKNAIVAINGGYFKPETGVPLGTLMIDKEIYTGPIYQRVGLGIADENYEMSRIKLDANIDTNIGGLKIDNVNQPRMLSTHTIVYTRVWGKTTPVTPKYGAQLVVEKGKVKKISKQSVEIPEKGFVIVGPEKVLSPFAKAKKIKLNIKINPEWNHVNHIVSGGPYLVKDGKIYVDMTAQKLSAIGGRNPRTAIGYTKDNHLIMLTVDGREKSSIGMTLFELAKIMKEYGCVNAMNLDGGSSTVMYIKGSIVNSPQIKGGIPLSHTLNVSLKS